MENILQRIHDPNLRFTLAFGIGLHHAGLHEGDRRFVEELFVNQKIHVCGSIQKLVLCFSILVYN